MPGRTPRSESGITLVELMVTVAVVAVLLVVATPWFADFFERYRLRSAVDDTIALFAHARQAAVESDRNVTVGTNATHWCVGAVQATVATEGHLVPTAPAACDCTNPAACLVDGAPLVADSGGRPGVTVSASGGDFTFDSKNGALTDLDDVYQLTFLSSTGRYGLEITVGALGQVQACVPSGKRPIPGYEPC